ncbi:N-acetyltransferase [Streptomyces sp. WAC05374]|uniref:GNAT family N-acetyltransferase n=1 Tax=Streptomyces sp. WAC05374 TaxID=2487420 RepID=UPI000F891C75|nr:GNAT family N-acetyltransferase [Streptomyces sp. WAC05374]RST13155.1 N-acetyltransferase [Streptomyces sp. WAC05374]TDF48291.1 N-acetyltransferase [Streptomyces sp. WAC05374]TDF49256.1 N-acetyltransferase [Streptomyces sp. WAC05374]TDF55224.1 N-acetyltransferase [Streptomyces sp. WAC05374]
MITTDCVYERAVDGFGTVRLVRVDPDRDAELLHDWVSGERARFWGMREAGVDDVREIYAHLDSLTTHHAFLAYRDGVPVALFQTYEPEADRVSECYDAEPGDIGVHLLLAPTNAPERGFSSHLVSALVSYALTGHRRIVAEPDAANDKAIALLVRNGFEPGPEVVLPEVVLPEVHIAEKRARLLFLTR